MLKLFYTWGLGMESQIDNILSAAIFKAAMFLLCLVVIFMRAMASPVTASLLENNVKSK